MIRTSDAAPIGCSLEDAITSGHWPVPFKLQRLDDMTCGPMPTAAAIGAAVEFAGFDMFTADDHPDVVAAGMLAFIEMQRQSLYDDQICWVGGHAELITINAEGISHRILKRWPDKIGERMKPAPPVWSTFRPSAQVISLPRQRERRNR